MLGVNFGQNEEKQNLHEIREKIQENIKIWALTPICLMERAQVAKSYMYAHLNYKLKSIDTSNEILKKRDNEIIKYLWGFNMHYINKETLHKGGKGQGFPNPVLIK
jgi:hypothetical protein